jgi:hypothetical protein
MLAKHMLILAGSSMLAAWMRLRRSLLYPSKIASKAELRLRIDVGKLSPDLLRQELNRSNTEYNFRRHGSAPNRRAL